MRKRRSSSKRWFRGQLGFIAVLLVISISLAALFMLSISVYAEPAEIPGHVLAATVTETYGTEREPDVLELEDYTDPGLASMNDVLKAVSAMLGRDDIPLYQYDAPATREFVANTIYIAAAYAGIEFNGPDEEVWEAVVYDCDDLPRISQEAIKAMLFSGIMYKISMYSFGPDEAVTNEEFAQVLDNFEEQLSYD